MTDLNWQPFDYENKPGPGVAPHAYALVWIADRDAATGVDLGYFDGYTFRLWGGSDDVTVTHWAEIVWPKPPKGA